MKWAKNGDIGSDKYRIIYTDREKNERGLGLILDQNRKKSVLRYTHLSEIILVIKWK